MQTFTPQMKLHPRQILGRFTKMPQTLLLKALWTLDSVKMDGSKHFK